MNLMETLGLLGFIVSVLTLTVDVVRLILEIVTKFSQRKDDDNKKD
mgnify:CR=1 FL=1